jgi:hypothetical protein
MEGQEEEMRRMMLPMLGLLALAAACGPVDEHTYDANEPEWVVRGSGAFKEKGHYVFYGVGMVDGMRNRALARSTCENRARADLQKVFETYTASLMRDYMAATTGNDPNESFEEQHVEQTIKTFSSGTLSGVMIVNHWMDDEGVHYALAKLDLRHFEGALDKMKKLDERTRKFIRSNARKAFDVLEKEELKH